MTGSTTIGAMPGTIPSSGACNTALIMEATIGMLDKRTGRSDICVVQRYMHGQARTKRHLPRQSMAIQGIY